MNAPHLQRAIEVMTSGGAHDDDSLVERLVKDGVDRGQAEWVVALLPVAFIRVAFGDRLSFPFTYYCMAADGRISGEYPLSEQPIFMQAMTAARAADRHTLVTIMERGAEFSAINKAVSAGHKAKTLELSPPVFLRATRPASRKPWWKIW